MPPLLMSSVRFLIAGAALYAFASRGRPRPTAREWGAAAMALLVTTSAWAGGSLYARGATLPESALLAAAMQMLAASVFLGVAGLALGQASDVHASSFAAKQVIAFIYLVVVGSLIAFSA